MTYQAINQDTTTIKYAKIFEKWESQKCKSLNESNHHLNELIHSGSPEIGQKVIRDSNHDSDSSKHYQSVLKFFRGDCHVLPPSV